ncbi:hypothetical protein L1887_13896 [Cichorium endivia]|nr:hypothetical protein L1887_13896 [Cichorium endivia]
MEHLNNISPELTIGDDEGFEIKYLGGLKVCLRFRTINDVTSFMTVSKEWFSSFRRCDGVEEIQERTAWIRIVGVPANLWNKDNFSSIASRFGRVLIPFDVAVDARDLSHGSVCILTDNFRRIEDVLMVEANGRLSKIGVFEMDDYWFPLKSASNGTGQPCSETDMDDDGISDTIFDDGDNVVNDILEEGEIPSDSDENGNRILEEGEISSDVKSVEVVMESVFEPGDEPGEQTDAVTSGDGSGEDCEPIRNLERLHGNNQASRKVNPIINNKGVNCNISAGGNSIPHTHRMEHQMEMNILEPNNHVCGPNTAEAQTGEINNNSGAHRENFMPFIFQSDPGPNLNFNMGTALTGKRRRIPSPSRIISNKKSHTLTEMTQPIVQQNLESPQSPSINVNRCISQTDPLAPLAPGDDVNSPNGSINEVVRTVEIGQAVEFQIDGGNEILAVVLGEKGEMTVNQ